MFESVGCSAQVAAKDIIEVFFPESVSDALGLLDSFLCEISMTVALEDMFDISGCLTVSDEIKFHIFIYFKVFYYR